MTDAFHSRFDEVLSSVRGPFSSRLKITEVIDQKISPFSFLLGNLPYGSPTHGEYPGALKIDILPDLDDIRRIRFTAAIGGISIHNACADERSPLFIATADEVDDFRTALVEVGGVICNDKPYAVARRKISELVYTLDRYDIDTYPGKANVHYKSGLRQYLLDAYEEQRTSQILAEAPGYDPNFNTLKYSYGYYDLDQGVQITDLEAILAFQEAGGYTNNNNGVSWRGDATAYDTDWVEFVYGGNANQN